MPEIESLLRTEAERWRDVVDARFASTAVSVPVSVPAQSRRRSRPTGQTFGWIASAAAAVAAVTAIVLVGGRADQGGSSASGGSLIGSSLRSAAAASSSGSAAAAANGGLPCVAGSLRIESPLAPGGSTQPRAVGVLVPGGSVTVLRSSDAPAGCAGGAPVRPTRGALAHTGRSIALVLRTADGHTRVLATFRPPRSDGAFSRTVTVPATSALGPATITDGQGDTVSVVIGR